MCAPARSCGEFMSVGTVIILTISLLLLIYLTVALLRPEKF